MATPHVEKMEVNNHILPAVFKLSQNYPNPFNPSTRFTFEIPQVKDNNVDVTLTIYNLLGQQIKTLYEGILASGSYTMEWAGRDIQGNPAPSGLYLYELRTNYFTQQKKMLLIR